MITFFLLAGEAVFKQVRHSAGLILVRMRQEKVAAFADELLRQMGQRIAAVAALVAAVHNEGRGLAAHKITVALLGTGVSRQIKLHNMPPRRWVPHRCGGPPSESVNKQYSTKCV